MGANNSSSWKQTNNNALASTLPMKNQVIHFHSSTTWKIHFDSLKQTNKLVIFIFTWFFLQTFQLRYFIQVFFLWLLDCYWLHSFMVWSLPTHGASYQWLRLYIYRRRVHQDWCGWTRCTSFYYICFAFKFCIVLLIRWKQDVAQEYGVQAMPTFVLIKQGKIVDQLVGADKDGLKKKIEINKA